MNCGYDNIAFVYDRLSTLVYGNAFIKVEQFLAKAIPAGSSVLIAGGGTGRILEYIANKHPYGLHITYVDYSANMIAIAKKRAVKNNTVNFIQQDIKTLQISGTFDVVITPFFLDNFSDKTCKVVCSKLHNLLNVKGLWLFADFQISKGNGFWQKPLLAIMYIFFRLLCGIEASRLPAIKLLFDSFDYRPIAGQTFFKNFIGAVVYETR